MDKNDNLKKGVRFSAENQPSSESKSKGWKKAYIIKNIAAQLVKGESKEALEGLANYLGVEVDKIDLETAMHLKQMEKALKEGDTKAYNAVMDRINGKPMQQIDHTSKGNEIKNDSVKVEFVDYGEDED